MGIIITLIILIIISIASLGFSFYTIYKFYTVKKVTEELEDYTINEQREADGAFWTFEDVKNMKLNFRDDFYNNIMPVIESHVSHWIITQAIPHMNSENYKFTPVDRFVREHQDEFITRVLNGVCGTQRKYFTKYMYTDSLDLYIGQIAISTLVTRVAQLMPNDEGHVNIDDVLPKI